MDLNVSVKLDATDKLIDAALMLAAAFNGGKILKRVVSAPPTATSPLVPAGDKKPAPAEDKAAGAEGISNAGESPAEDKVLISDEAGRALVMKKSAECEKNGTKKEMTAKIKALFKEFGVKSSPELPQERRVDFYEKLNAL